ncbi:MAG: Aldose sugar dehydrogenase YliI [Gammaproteobacteria bacterium]|nr:MAG: Aldose sugar dehydrogenase YliI [Gammaproteobacteria bacterium]
MFPYPRCLMLVTTAILLAFSLIEKVAARVEVVATDLDHPWSLAWINPTEVLITERSGQLIHLNLNSGKRKYIKNVPSVTAVGQGGLLDVQIVTIDNKLWVYLALSGTRTDQSTGTELWRGRLINDALVNPEKLYALPATTTSGRHFGGRIAINDRNVFLTIGDRGERERAQDLADSAGSIIRLNLDGSIPSDNPSFSSPDALTELYSVGHRNPQGIAFDAEGNLFAHEHGPQGGDEVNQIEAGKNYGWPIITYGRNYGIGTAIGEGVEKEGLEQPLLYWDPSIAPSGMTFYLGERFPQWTNNLFIGALKAQMLVRLTFEDRRLKQKERLYRGEFGRIRDVREGPDGALYLLTDSTRGQLLRITP